MFLDAFDLYPVEIHNKGDYCPVNRFLNQNESSTLHLDFFNLPV